MGRNIMLNRKHTGALLLITLILSGCASSLSGGAYSRDQARKTQEVQMATVESVRNVQIEGTKTPIGSGAGAVVGGVAGSGVGSGKGSTVGSVLGAVAGGLLGAAAEEGLTRQPGLEITVRFDSGRMVAVTQAADEQFQIGDRVRVLSGGGVTRISH
jgi:Outer membrane lipoprotein